ncbi:MAG TPA: hypothetical protein VLY03_08060 [Bacteroidota bacterium]|nr:hypothetical protein [Bacteroidota bacterium]
MKTPTPDFPAIFARLRAILQEHASSFIVLADRADYYCLNVRFSPKFRGPFPIAWVKISKSYVSFHFMPIYFAPKLRKDLSAGLRARMQGKSCFNFKVVNDQLFDELRRLTVKGFEVSKKANVV